MKIGEKDLSMRKHEAATAESPLDDKADLDETRYCDHSHESIRQAAESITQGIRDRRQWIQRVFHFVRDEIVFGGDLWAVRASDTLKKGYGACYNKNLLFIALMRRAGVPARLMANPMQKTFMKPAMGMAYVTVSHPFLHCFSRVWIADRWRDVDPTLDRRTYETFFAPLKAAWTVEWDGRSDMLLYRESIMGESHYFADIDTALDDRLGSHFLFSHEPGWLLSGWLAAGNAGMWRKTGNRPREYASSQKNSPPDEGFAISTGG